jgi:mutator protein MutT
MKRVVIAIILGPENLVLMGQRKDNNKWTFPAGSCEEGETPEQAIIRETKEETGLDILSSKLVMAGTERNLALFVYLCTTDSTQSIDTSKDPDKEMETLTYEDPFDRISELHVPAHKNWALHWLANK